MPRLRERLLITCPFHTSIGRISSYVWTCTCNKIPNFAFFFVLSMYLYVFVYWQVYLSCSWARRVTAPQMVGVVKAPQRWKTFMWKVAVLGGLWRFLDTFLRGRSEDRRPSGCCGSARLSPVLLKISFTPSEMVAVIELAGIWSSSSYNGAWPRDGHLTVSIPPMWFGFLLLEKAIGDSQLASASLSCRPRIWRSRLTAVTMETVWLCSGLFGSNVAGLFQHYFVLDLNVGVHRCL